MRLSLAVILLVLLTACGGGDEKPSSAAPLTPTPTASVDGDLNVQMDQREKIFVDLVRDSVPDFADSSAESLLNVGNGICDSVTIDATIEQTLVTLKALIDAGYEARTAGELMAYSSALCPEKQLALSIDR